MIARWLPVLLLACLAVLAQEEPDAGVAHSGGDWTEWRVRSLRCTGLQRTDSTVILRELELRPGVGYSDQALEEDALAVKNTNLFARLVVSVNPDSADEAVDIVYAVSERPRWLAYPILAPTDRLGWVYGFALMNRNLAGKGRRLDLQAEYGEHLSYTLYLQEPWFLGRRQQVSLLVNRSSRSSAEDDFRRISKEVRLGWQRRLDRQTQWGLHPSWTEIAVRDRRPDPSQGTRNPLGLDVFGGLGLSAEHNSTDFHASPRRGVVAVGGLSAFGLSSPRMPAGWAGSLSLSRFLPLGESLVLGMNGAADWVAGRRADYMKHYLGQRGRVRAGGLERWPGWSLCHGGVELRATLLPRRVLFQHVDLGLGAVAFLDGGIVWDEIFEGRRLAAGGAGVGLRLFAPFVEVGRVDLAWSPTHGAMIQIGQGHSF